MKAVAIVIICCGIVGGSLGLLTASNIKKTRQIKALASQASELRGRIVVLNLINEDLTKKVAERDQLIGAQVDVINLLHAEGK